MSAPRVSIEGTPTVSVDPDPNVTAPGDDRIFSFNPPGQSEGIWVAASGGSPTLEVWFKEPRSGRWLRMNIGGASSFSPAADELLNLGLGSFVWGLPAFLRVQAAGGATKVWLGTLQK